MELTCPRWRRARHPGLIVHESLAFDAIDIVMRDAIPVTTAARTLFDLAGVCGPGTLDLAIDNALRRRLTTAAELAATRDRLARSGRKGSRPFGVAVGRRTGVTESEAERRLLQLMHRQGLAEPVVQHEILDDEGRFVARVDFAYPDLRIAIEYDSYEHHMGTVAHERDGARRNAVLAVGWYPSPRPQPTSAATVAAWPTTSVARERCVLASKWANNHPTSTPKRWLRPGRRRRAGRACGGRSVRPWRW